VIEAFLSYENNTFGTVKTDSKI